ncbi:S66 peptidase family protein [Ferruginibacter albus]|uniref:S66 peptidase family protein n=1 Tax=Ferruginibacter albus TaxID=2875540 RepID=UPI001CC6F287|nr:LD-carboxypeptidase [Ferruginibacter albus]UAY52565.1 LD-carboxypeptidase [Ferruginibacter albus]
MNRKNFLSSIIPLGAVASGMLRGKDIIEESQAVSKVPLYLKSGDTIGICCTAGYISLEDTQPAINKLKEWGFKIRVGSTIGKRDFTFGGTDEERLNDFQQMLDNKMIKAIMCARGGYGAIRIIDSIDFSRFTNNPKWIIGFSDATVLHSHINSNYNIASLHSKMCNSFPADWSTAEPIQIDSIESIKKCLCGDKMTYTIAPNTNNKQGIAEGELIGGNLKTLETLSGSISEIKTAGKILFVEDTNEYLYSIDRMFWNLKRTNKLSKLKALIVGGFKTKNDDAGEEFGKTVEQIVLEKVKEYNYPVCFDFPVGHQKNNFALKCGVKHTLTVNSTQCTLTET